MTIGATTLRKLAMLGLNAEQMAGVLDILADGVEAEEARKSAQRERTRKARAKQRDVTVTLQSHDRNSDDTHGGVTRVEDKTSNLEIEPQKKEQKDAPGRDVLDFKAEFADLDAERLTALIKHRRAKHGQITGHAARLFRAAATSCNVSVSEAVDICIDRNWITLKPDWLNKPNGRAPPSQAPSMADVFEFAKHRQSDERQPEDFGGDGALVPYLSVAGQGRQ